MKTKTWLIASILILTISSITSCEEAPTKTEMPTPVPTIEPTPIPTPESQFPPAKVINDEGGPIIVTGEVEYTNPFFTVGVAEPIVILEDQAGFVDRDRNFIFPVESQVLGQISSDFYTSPFTYSLTLPLVPNVLRFALPPPPRTCPATPLQANMTLTWELWIWTVALTPSENAGPHFGQTGLMSTG